MTKVGVGKSVATTRRGDWEYNNTAISTALLRFYRDHRRRPTNTDLSKLTGLSLSTINRHFKYIDGNSVFKIERQRLQSLAGPIFTAIYNSAMKGSSRSQELALQLAFGWAKPRHFVVKAEVPANEPPEDAEDIDTLIDRLTRYRDDTVRLRKKGRQREAVGVSVSE